MANQIGCTAGPTPGCPLSLLDVESHAGGNLKLVPPPTEASVPVNNSPLAYGAVSGGPGALASGPAGVVGPW